ncbi:hypothetical protein BHE74_00002873 [Ensete ventricosum]|nr:hypothetical protein BHE74_00002873 [Ensete ventricosum]RZR76009.1 hypothetical protein BHM03_00000613 [Ensete ventricosum]
MNRSEPYLLRVRNGELANNRLSSRQKRRPGVAPLDVHHVITSELKLRHQSYANDSVLLLRELLKKRLRKKAWENPRFRSEGERCGCGEGLHCSCARRFQLSNRYIWFVRIDYL